VLALVRIAIARCSVDYTGRLSAHLPLATRLIIINADGSVVIHNDAGTKALNWMPAGSRLTVTPAQVTSTPAQESDSDGGPWNRISC
jgi:RecB family endonuclease NucS